MTFFPVVKNLHFRGFNVGISVWTFLCFDKKKYLLVFVFQFFSGFNLSVGLSLATWHRIKAVPLTDP